MEWIGTWAGAVLLHQSGTAYLLVNAAHILGVALLVGGILPLDLRLVGAFRSVPLAVIGPVLVRSAACGLVLALATGLWLFTVKPAEYLANAAFLWKLALLVLALLNVGLQHGNRRFRAALAGGAPAASVRLLAGCSAILWLSVLVAGRWIGFV
ncbi:MAG: DUF6644 family protein [Pseudomonadota bacterium]